MVIAGGGPTALMLACELRLAGVEPVVLERLPEISPIPKGNGLIGQIVPMLDYRGLLGRFSAGSTAAGPVPRFGRLRLMGQVSTPGGNLLARAACHARQERPARRVHRLHQGGRPVGGPHRRAPKGLLDSYQAERHLAGQRAILQARALLDLTDDAAVAGTVSDWITAPLTVTAARCLTRPVPAAALFIRPDGYVAWAAASGAAGPAAGLDEALRSWLGAPPPAGQH